MKLTESILVCAFIACVAVALFGCSQESHNLTTTEDSTAATVDDAGTIAAKASLISANTPTGETVTVIAGANLVLSLPATATGTVVGTFQNTVAVQFNADIKSYTQTVGNFMQSNLPVILADVGNASKLTSDLAKQLQAWGLDPANGTQRTVLDNVILIAAKVGTNAASINSTLTGIQLTGSVPALATRANP